MGCAYVLREWGRVNGWGHGIIYDGLYVPTFCDISELHRFTHIRLSCCYTCVRSAYPFTSTPVYLNKCDVPETNESKHQDLYARVRRDWMKRRDWRTSHCHEKFFMGGLLEFWPIIQKNRILYWLARLAASSYKCFFEEFRRFVRTWRKKNKEVLIL